MMFPSHLLATLVGCAILALARPMPRRDWLLAVAFGVAIDLDHLLQIPAYVATHGLQDLSAGAIMSWGGAWQGFMHTSWALALVVPACFAFRSLVPAAFWGLHMVQDFVVARHLVVFGSPTEWLVCGALLAALAIFAWADHARHGGGAALHEHVVARAMLVLPRR